jgi:hypothetical protein
MTDQNNIILRSADPFADVTGLSALDSGANGGASGQRSSNLIHIRIQQRSGKKTLTTVQVLLIFFEIRFVMLYFFRVLVKNSIKNVCYAHSKRNLLVMVLLSNIKSMVKLFNFKAINESM